MGDLAARWTSWVALFLKVIGFHVIGVAAQPFVQGAVPGIRSGGSTTPELAPGPVVNDLELFHGFTQRIHGEVRKAAGMGLGTNVDQRANAPPDEQRDELLHRAIAVADGMEGSCAHEAIMRDERDRWQISAGGFRNTLCGSPVRGRTTIC